jgi:hypothetical protein
LLPESFRSQPACLVFSSAGGGLPPAEVTVRYLAVSYRCDPAEDVQQTSVVPNTQTGNFERRPAL